MEDLNKQCKTVDQAVILILDRLLKTKPINIDFTYDMVKENIRIAIQKESQEDIVKVYGHYPKTESYLYVLVGDEHTTKVTQGLLDYVNMSLDDAWKFAEENTKKNIEFISMSDLFPIEEDDVMIICTNKERNKGASTLIFRDELRKCIKKKGWDKAFIIPSSIHEVLLVKYEESVDESDVKGLISLVNMTQVDPEEQLGDTPVLIQAETVEERYKNHGMITDGKYLVGTIRELAEYLSRSVDIGNMKFSDCDFAIAEFDDCDELEIVKWNSSGWFGVKQMDTGFDNEDMILFADYYGGYCSHIKSLYDGMTGEEMIDAIASLIRDTLGEFESGLGDLNNAILISEILDDEL